MAKDEPVSWPFSEKAENLGGYCARVEGDEKPRKGWLDVLSTEKRLYQSIKCASVGLRCRNCDIDLGYIPSSSQQVCREGFGTSQSRGTQ